MADHIKYLERNEIDSEKWNNCIANGTNSIIYAYSYYLDVLAKNWDALILNDYEAVMPLPWKKKWGFHYLYQPYFANSLGILGKKLPHDIEAAFISAIPHKFNYWELDFNEHNNLFGKLNNVEIKKRKNQFKLLNQPYDQLTKTYSRLAKRMVRKSLEHLNITSTFSPECIISLYRTNYEKTHNLPKYAYDNLIRFCQIGLKKGNVKTFASTFKDGEIASFYLILFDQKFVYSLLGGSTDKGKDIGAFYLLTDSVLKEFSNSEKVFRFEGSDSPGISFFNQQFGTYPVTYYHLRKDDLPYPISILKKINDKIKREPTHF